MSGGSDKAEHDDSSVGMTKLMYPTSLQQDICAYEILCFRVSGRVDVDQSSKGSF